MKLIVFVAVVAVAAAQYVPGSDKDAETVRHDFEQAVDNSYRLGVETTNGIVVDNYGESLPGPEPETGSFRMSGSYSYQTPEGNTVTVNWVADELGYRASSDAIPEGAGGQEAADAAGAAPVQTESV